MTNEQTQIITDFFAHMVGHKAVRSMDINIYIPDFGKVVMISSEGLDNLGVIGVRGIGVFPISDLLDTELTSFIAFIQQMNALRDGVEKDCKTQFPGIPFDLFFDCETAKQSRFLLVNNLHHCDYDKQYKTIHAALTALGYTVKRDPTDSSVAYIIKYKAAYLTKNRFGKFLYNISHVG